MAKAIHDDILDSALNDLKADGNEIVVCETEPTTYLEAHTTYMLANHVLAAGDYTVSNGDTNGRKVRIAEQAGIAVTNSGTAGFVCITDTVGSRLLLKTTCTPQALTAGNTVTIPAFDDEIADPT
jgi:hypothetical protein